MLAAILLLICVIMAIRHHNRRAKQKGSEIHFIGSIHTTHRTSRSIERMMKDTRRMK